MNKSKVACASMLRTSSEDPIRCQPRTRFVRTVLIWFRRLRRLIFRWWKKVTPWLDAALTRLGERSAYADYVQSEFRSRQDEYRVKYGLYPRGPL